MGHPAATHGTYTESVVIHIIWLNIVNQGLYSVSMCLVGLRCTQEHLGETGQTRVTGVYQNCVLLHMTKHS